MDNFVGEGIAVVNQSGVAKKVETDARADINLRALLRLDLIRSASHRR